MKNLSLNKAIRPKLNLLGEEDISRIHNYSLAILAKTGIRIESKEAIEVFKASDGVRIDQDVIKISGELVESAIKTACSNVEVYNKNGDLAFTLGRDQGDDTYFGIGVTNPYYQEIESSSLVPFRREHMRHSTKLGDMLENYDMISTLGVPSDVEVEKSDLYSTLDMYANTDKPLVLLISKEENIHKVIELLHYLHDDIGDKPFCIPYLNPITPLVLNKATTDKMAASFEHNLPVMFSNYCMYGGSAPITEAGTLALLNAELLAGLVYSQLLKEGSKLILGSLPASFNMTSMGSSYTPTTYLLNIACAEMMEYYNLPHCGTSGSSNAWGSDLISSADFWLNHLTSCIGKIGCAPFVGGSFDSMAFSPANVVLSNEIIGMARKFAAGFEINDSLVNLDEINTAGPGGNFFTSQQTLDTINETGLYKSIWPPYNKDSWLAAGSPKARGVLIEYTMEIYERCKIESDRNTEIITRGEYFINS